MTISRRSLLSSAAVLGAAAVLPTIVRAAPHQPPADFAAEHLGPIDDAHREWHDIWSRRGMSVIMAPVGAGLTSHLSQRMRWEQDQPGVAHIVRLTGYAGHSSGIGTHNYHEMGPELAKTAPIDLLIIDGIDSYASVLTTRGRTATLNRINAMLDRMAPDGRVWAAGHRWANIDTLEVLRHRPGTFFAQYDATKNMKATFPTTLPMEKVVELSRMLGYQFSELMLYHRVVQTEQVTVSFAGSDFQLGVMRDGDDYTFPDGDRSIHCAAHYDRMTIEGRRVRGVTVRLDGRRPECMITLKAA